MTKKEIAFKVQNDIMSCLIYTDDDVNHKEDMKKAGDNDDFRSNYKKMVEYANANGSLEGYTFRGDCDDAALTAADLLFYNYGIKAEDIATGYVFILDNDTNEPVYGHLVCFLRNDEKTDAYVIDINIKNYTDKAANTEVLKHQTNFAYMTKIGAVNNLVANLTDILKDEGLIIKSPSPSFTDERYKFAVEKIITMDNKINSYYEKEAEGWDFISYMKR